jgi:hypothetical protein
VAGFEPRPLRPELRAGQSMGVISAGRRPLPGVVGQCWSASLLYFAAVQLRWSRRAGTSHVPARPTRRGAWCRWAGGVRMPGRGRNRRRRDGVRTCRALAGGPLCQVDAARVERSGRDCGVPPGRLVGGRRAARPWGGSCGVVAMGHGSRGVGDARVARGIDDTLNSGIRSPFSTTGIRFFCNAERAATRMGYAQAGVSTVVEYTSIGAAGGVRAGGEPWHASQPRLLRNDTALLRYGYGHHSSLQLLRPVIAESWCVGA